MNKTKHVYAITRQEKLQVIAKQLGDHVKQKGSFFIPATEFYENWNGDDYSLTLMGRKLCLWLGVKPHNLTFLFTEGLNVASQYVQDEDGHRILVADSYSTQPVTCAAALARECIQYLAKGRKNLTFEVDESEFIDLATIYLGLGIVLMNGNEPVPSGLNLVAKSFRSSSNGRTFSPFIRYYSLEEYGALILAYAQNNHIDESWVISQLFPWARLYIHPKFHTSEQHIKKPAYVEVAEGDISNGRGKLILASIAVLLTALLAGIIVALRPNQLPVAVQEQKQKVELLQRLYEICGKNVQQKQSEYDLTDIFMQRQIEARQSLCTSLRNQYNYEAEQYKRKVESL